jgi:hypothetical protein
MSEAVEFLLEPLAFAVLATIAFRFGGRVGLAVAAIGWMAVRWMHILASLPAPDVPLHDFERSPVPGIAAMVAGTLAGGAFVVLQRRQGPLWLRLIATAVVYLIVAIPVSVAAFVAIMM